MKIVKKIPDAIGTLGRHCRFFLPRLNFARFLNICIMIIEMLLKRERLLSKPVVAKIEACSVCNLRCFGCRSGKGKSLVEYSGGSLTVSDFEVILDKLGKHLFEVVLYIWGEPLLNKNIAELINAAHKRNISVAISTNLHQLTEETSKKLLDAGLDKMIFCIDGWSQKTYEEVRIRGDFELVRANVKRFIDLRNESKSKKPYMEWQYIVTSQNKSELKYAQEAAEEWGVEKFTEIVDWGKRLKEKEYFKGLQKTKKKMYEKNNKCYWLWSSIAIQFDGNVFPCCHVANKPHDNRIFGNILTDDFGLVWNSVKYRQARLLMKSNREISEGEFICKYCCSPPIFTEKSQ